MDEVYKQKISYLTSRNRNANRRLMRKLISDMWFRRQILTVFTHHASPVLVVRRKRVTVGRDSYALTLFTSGLITSTVTNDVYLIVIA